MSFKKHLNKRASTAKRKLFRNQNSGGTHRLKKSKRLTLFNKDVHHILKWLSHKCSIPTSAYNHSLRYMSFIDHMYREKGLKATIAKIKDDRLSVTQYLSSSRRFVPGLTYDGLPRKLGGLIPGLRVRDPAVCRYTLTLLTSLRRFNLPPDPDLESITSPDSSQYYEWIFKYLPRFCRQVCRLLPKNLKIKGAGKLRCPTWKGFHLTTKGSPSGSQALADCLNDLVSLPESLISSIKTIGGKDLSSKMDLCRSYVNELSEIVSMQTVRPSRSFRKLSAFPDSEGKTRVIALGDYWSQTCLRPLHDLCSEVLRYIPQDQTFNQGEGLKDLPFDSSTTYYSVDLTAFTDRFPIKILFGFIDYNFGRTYALAWYDILVGYGFDYKTPKGFLNDIRYSVGNPMGFYSSWPLTTICHHFIVFVACQEIGISWFRAEYRLLGDDIVLWNDDLAREYKRLIILLGVEVSEQKTHTGCSLFEFAKRYFTPEGEISPFSIRAGLSEAKSYISFIELLSSSYERGWRFDSLLEAALEFYSSRPNAFRRRDRKRQVKKIKHSLHLYKRLSGHDDDLNFIRKVIDSFDCPQLSCNQLHVAKAIFNQCIVSCFERAASSFYGDLHLRLERGLMYFTMEEVDCVDALYAHPFAFVYGRYVEEMYLSAMQKAWDFDALYSGEWLPYFRTLKVADANQIFTSRDYLSERSTSPLLLKELYNKIDVLRTSPYL